MSFIGTSTVEISHWNNLASWAGTVFPFKVLKENSNGNVKSNLSLYQRIMTLWFRGHNPVFVPWWPIILFTCVILLQCLRQYWHLGAEQSYIFINLGLVSQRVKMKNSFINLHWGKFIFTLWFLLYYTQVHREIHAYNWYGEVSEWRVATGQHHK